MNRSIKKASGLLGNVTLPADKSVAHRAAILAALGDGRSRLVNYPGSADPQSLLDCLRRLGVEFEDDDGILSVEGRGLEGLRAPNEPLDCGNSGTAMRLIAGVLAGQPFGTTLIGDASLSSRPMKRIAEPLGQMGARLTLTEGHAPIHIEGGSRLKGIEYVLPVASAQVKSCVLLAGLFAEGETTVVETVRSRDHTERMLGLDAFESGSQRYLTIQGGRRIPGRTWAVPRDFSAAAFFLVAGALASQGDLRMAGVGLNPTRNALLDVLQAMGADITISNERVRGGEPIGDLRVQPSQLHGVSVGGSIIPNLIDEIPVLAVAAALAEGRTEIRDAAELRVKETDRLAAMARNLNALGAAVTEQEDGLVIEGGKPLHGTTVESFGDHRIAMSMGIAGLMSEGTTTIIDAGCADVSFPGFWEQLDALSL